MKPFILLHQFILSLICTQQMRKSFILCYMKILNNMKIEYCIKELTV